MLRATALAFATAAILVTGNASAQVIDLGRGGPSIDLRSDKQRDRDYQREQARRDTYGPRRYDREDLSTGSVRGGCREVTVREQDEYGRTVTRRRSDC